MPSCVVCVAGRIVTPGRGCGGAGLVSSTTLVGRETELGAGEQIGHGLRVVDRAIEILERSQFAAAVDAAGRMFGRCAGGLIGIDADEQRPLSLRDSERRGNNSSQGTQRSKRRFHAGSGYEMQTDLEQSAKCRIRIRSTRIRSTRIRTAASIVLGWPQRLWLPGHAAWRTAPILPVETPFLLGCHATSIARKGISRGPFFVF